MSARHACALALLLFTSAAAAQHNLDAARRDWPDLAVLEPAQVRVLGPALRADLQRRGCRITMFTRWDGAHNVIRGSFIAAGQTDVAVLCLAGDDMSIIVYAGGAADLGEPIRKFPADAYRMITRVSPFVLPKRAIRDNVTTELPAFDHDGIDDGAVGGRSETAYHHDGRWLSLF